MTAKWLADHADHFRARVLEDALTEALPAYWRMRADQLDAARHRPGVDNPGQAPLDDLRARWVDLTDAADACRRHANLLAEGLPDFAAAEVAEVLREVA